MRPYYPETDQPRYDEATGTYRDCKWCHGKGCLACPAEADKAYKAEYPDGPKPIATFPNTPDGIDQAMKLVMTLLPPDRLPPAVKDAIARGVATCDAEIGIHNSDRFPEATQSARDCICFSCGTAPHNGGDQDCACEQNPWFDADRCGQCKHNMTCDVALNPHLYPRDPEEGGK